MKRRNFIKGLFQVTAVALLATTPLMVIPSIKKDFIKIEWGEIKFQEWDSKGYKVGYGTMTITGEGEKYEAIVKVFDKFQGT